MSSDADIDLDSPGLAFSKLLRLAKPGRVKTLLPGEMLDIMDGLEPGFSTSEQLTALAVNMLDPAETLHVRRQSFSDLSGRFVTEALVRFLFEFRRPQPGAATGVFGLSAS